MTNTFHFQFEILMIYYIQELVMKYPFLIDFFTLFTYFGEAEICSFIVMFLYMTYDKNLGRLVTLSITCNAIFNAYIKNIFHRARPYMVDDKIKCFKIVNEKYDINDVSKQGYSFPSGHCVNITSIINSIYLYTHNKKVLITGSFLIFFVALSRVALGVHYPTDVLIGTLLGIVCTVILTYLFDKVEKKKLYLYLLIFNIIGLFFCDSHDYFSTLGLYIGFILGDLFNDKYNDFKLTDNKFKMFLRLLFAAILFLGINSLLKKLVITDNFMMDNIFTVIRYFVTTFIVVAIYPLTFKYKLLS